MEGKQTLRSLRFRNVLSFGDAGQELELGPLNVLIGPNGSGKSNVFEVLNLLRSLPRDLSAAVRDADGIDELLWKASPEPQFEVGTSWDFTPGLPPLKHQIALRSEKHRPEVVEERIWQGDVPGLLRHYYFLPAVGQYGGPDYYDAIDRVNVAMATGRFRTDASILSQRKDPDRSPALAFLGDSYAEFLLYRRWSFGPDSPIRNPPRADVPGDFLSEDYSNLGLILTDLMSNRTMRTILLDSLGNLYEGAEYIRIKIVSGFVQLHVEEDGGRLIPATRLSDGTLRYLSLLAILCHPNPPPFLGIEEPELGLHPDAVSTIARLLIEAAQRTQLIITTHSASLISALGDVPESVVVCERGIEGTELRRLEPERLRKWLDEYTLGDLWMSGEIGGRR